MLNNDVNIQLENGIHEMILLKDNIFIKMKQLVSVKQINRLIVERPFMQG